MIPASATVVATNQQVSSDLADEAVILHLERGLYYGLNEVGALIWRLVQTPQSIATLRAAVLSEYEVTPDECDRDLLALLEELAAERLIEIRNA